MPLQRLDRRAILGTIGAGITVGLAGCSSSTGGNGNGNGDGNGNGNGNGNGAQPDPDQTYEGSVSAAEEPQNFNPLKNSRIIAGQIWKLTYSTLTYVDPNLNVYPELATDWSVNDEGTEWTFDLRDDATFNELGTTVTADDVVATFDAIQDPDIPAPGQGALGPIDTVEAIDDNTVQFNLTAPYTQFPTIMADRFAVILPKEILESEDPTSAFDDTDYGSGAFNLENYSPQNAVTLVANENYYKTDDDGNKLPYIDELTLDIITDSNARMNAFADHRIDITTQIPTSQWERIQNLQGVDANEKAGSTLFAVYLDTDSEPFSDIRIQHAVKYAMDKRAILNSVSNGRGTIAQHHPITPEHQVYADLDDRFGVGAETDKAEQLLADAGHAGGMQLPTLITPTYVDALESQAVLLQQQLQEVGLEFDIERVTLTEWIDSYWLDTEFTTSRTTARVTPNTLLDLMCHSDGAWAEATGLFDEEFDTALDNAKSAQDTQTQMEEYRKVQEICQDRGGLLISYFENQLSATHDNVSNFSADPFALQLPLTETIIE